jgi:glycosyltransferase involved in cell wall biosynthesis
MPHLTAGSAVSWILGLFLGTVWLSRVAIVWWNRNTVADISRPEYAGGDDQALPCVSIIVPARNEAEHIESALRSLLQLDYPDYEVIAVDDRSEDATGVIVDRLANEWRLTESAHQRLDVLHVSHLPSGWLGKVHAMWKAAQQATGDWLLFTDADVVFRPDALRRAVLYGEREHADHVVLFPTMIMNSVGERMMMAFFSSQFVFAHRPWKVSDSKSRDSVGAGAFNLVRRSVYQQIGTHTALRLSVLDDMKLGELVKQHGFRQRCAFGRDLLRLRWIVGASGMLRNLSKNFFAILRFSIWFAMAAICGVLLINAGPFVGVCFAHGWARAGYLAALMAIVAVYFGMSGQNETSPLYFFLHPVGAIVFVFAMARSVALTLRQGGISWRGTFYRLAELKQFRRESPDWNWL